MCTEGQIVVPDRRVVGRGHALTVCVGSYNNLVNSCLWGLQTRKSCLMQENAHGVMRTQSLSAPGSKKYSSEVHSLPDIMVRSYQQFDVRKSRGVASLTLWECGYCCIEGGGNVALIICCLNNTYPRPRFLTPNQCRHCLTSLIGYCFFAK